jgi:threonyl-tRNA synthetase
MLDDDHRRVGKRLDLFHFQEEAPGMVFWHPRGFAMYRALEELARRRMRADGFVEVRSPQLLRRPIWEASGHWQSFRDGMFSIDGDDAAALKPVSCPGHAQIVDKMAPSHRDLPIRLGELGLVHRAEASGCLSGLLRLRQFCQDDGHVFCRDDQVEAELARVLGSMIELYRAFGVGELRVAFSSRPSVRAGSDEIWDRAERLLSRAARDAGLEPELQPGQGAFYGPKLEVLLEDRRGNAWQCGTLQLDYLLPGRFDLGYVDASGARQRPVMIHRALLGSLERFLGLLLERHGARVPEWLAPEQVVVVPVSAEHAPFAEHVALELSRRGVRAELDARSERLSRRVRDAHERGVPLVAVVGAREVAELSLALREPDGSSSVSPLDVALRELEKRFRPAA